MTAGPRTSDVTGSSRPAASATRSLLRLFGRTPRWLTAAWAMTAIELFLTCDCAAWSFQLALPPAVFVTSRGYDRMAEVAPEWAWSIAFLLVTAVAGISLIRENRYLRVIAACLLGTILAAVAGLIYVGNPAGAAWETYAGIAALSYWLMGVRFFESL